jgi:hypothetical protein
MSLQQQLPPGSQRLRNNRKACQDGHHLGMRTLSPNLAGRYNPVTDDLNRGYAS